MTKKTKTTASKDLKNWVAGRRFATVLADPPWRFKNGTRKVAPEHRRLNRYGTLSLEEIKQLPVAEVAAPISHLYLWVPNALLAEGLAVMEAWGFTYKSNIVWHKIRKDGGSDGRGVGRYFRNVTELVLFGVRGKKARTLAPGRRPVNLLATRKQESTLVSQMNFIRSSKRVHPVHFWSYLHVAAAETEKCGAIRRTRLTSPLGQRTKITVLPE
jgi:N6-adenosine-specific RNA methylase IME4